MLTQLIDQTCKLVLLKISAVTRMPQFQKDSSAGVETFCQRNKVLFQLSYQTCLMVIWMAACQAGQLVTPEPEVP